MPAATLFNKEARTATAKSGKVSMATGVPQRGVLLILDITKTPNNAETLTPAIQAYDFASEKWVSITAFAATANGTTLGAEPTSATFLYTIYPGGVETAATTNHEVQALPIPVFWRAQVTHSGSGSWTYTLTYQPLQ